MTHQIQTKYGARLFAAVLSQTLTKGMITVMCNRLRRYNRPFSSLIDDRKQAFVDDIEKVIELIEEFEPRCTPEHEASGIAWLRSIALTPKGNRRLTPFGKKFTEHELGALDDVEAIHLVYIDFQYVNSGGGGYDLPVPCYRVTGRDGAYFKYHMTPWQSPIGSTFEIFEQGFAEPTR